jgi:hypothetical protein
MMSAPTCTLLLVALTRTGAPESLLSCAHQYVKAISIRRFEPSKYKIAKENGRMRLRL